MTLNAATIRKTSIHERGSSRARHYPLYRVRRGPAPREALLTLHAPTIPKGLSLKHNLGAAILNPDSELVQDIASHPDLEKIAGKRLIPLFYTIIDKPTSLLAQLMRQRKDLSDLLEQAIIKKLLIDSKSNQFSLEQIQTRISPLNEFAEALHQEQSATNSATIPLIPPLQQNLFEAAIRNPDSHAALALVAHPKFLTIIKENSHKFFEDIRTTSNSLLAVHFAQHPHLDTINEFQLQGLISSLKEEAPNALFLSILTERKDFPLLIGERNMRIFAREIRRDTELRNSLFGITFRKSHPDYFSGVTSTRLQSE